jgi:hypothetical protein
MSFASLVSFSEISSSSLWLVSVSGANREALKLSLFRSSNTSVEKIWSERSLHFTLHGYKP